MNTTQKPGAADSAKHTPGPWTPTGHDGKMSVIVESQWGSVAKVLPIGAQDQENANAHLIAAAPDLLAALKRCEAKADYAKGNPRKQTDALFDILHLARAAISAAETP